MNEMMVAITGTVIVKGVLVMAVLEAAQYFHNQKLLWWWVLVLLAGINYSHTSSDKEETEMDGANEG